MRTRAPKYSARAIASVWRSPPDSVPTSLVRVADVDADALHLLAGDAGRLRGMSKRLSGPTPTVGSLPRKKFRVTLMSGMTDEVLVDRRDPGVERVARRAEDDRLAVDGERALVGRVDAGQGLDQRRLARAVVAEQAGDLPGADRQRDVLDGDDGAEVLRDVAGLEEGWLVGRRRGRRPRSATGVGVGASIGPSSY